MTVSDDARSCARTQRNLASRYAGWARSGGKRADDYAKEAARLRKDAKWWLNFAKQEERYDQSAPTS